MEVTVLVDGLPRVVCGVTAETTCQDVVIALAQATGRPGRYTLQEKFKDFERCMAPDERPLETLQKYGEQAREVRLMLRHNGPSASEDVGRAKVGRYQPCPPLRRKDAGARTRRGSGPACLHRQSLPPLSCSKQEAEHLKKEELKRPKRKSLTLMEEAWEWLESLGKGKVYSTARDKEGGKKAEKRNRNSLGISLTVDESDPASGGSKSKGKARGQKGVKSHLDQTSCCMGNQTRGKESKGLEAKPDILFGSNNATQDEKTGLRETIIHQVSRLQDLQVQIAHVDQLVSELEEQQGLKKAQQEAQQRIIQEEMEQIEFWENELKAEEAYEKDLQRQFLQMKENASGCKAKLEDYKRQMQGLDFCAAQTAAEQDSNAGADAATDVTAEPTEGRGRQQSDPDGGVDVGRKLPPREDLNAAVHARLPAGQMKERRPTGPSELREWWTRWAQTQDGQSETTKKAVTHRSELTIYLGGKKV
ncbi:ras association domain-containing protein 8 [Pungitius pungitius]|uniref:ras association domain-containing protein 8 n=1 Tax=Pungitius pungitius TaxID=134920 RepID=UPI002E163274